MLLFAEQAVAQSTALTIVTHLSAAESDYSQHARTINQAYADRHGYSFQAVSSNHAAAADRNARWSKVKILSEVLEADTEAGGAVLWMDHDAVFTNFNYSMLSLVENMKEHRAEMAVCRDLSAPKEASRQTCSPVCLNTGTLLLLNTEWTRQLLRTWWHAADEEFPNFRHGLLAHCLRVCVSGQGRFMYAAHHSRSRSRRKFVNSWARTCTRQYNHMSVRYADVHRYFRR